VGSLKVIDLVVLVAYVTGTVAVGLWVGRKSRSTEEFMAAGRRIPGWAVGLSIFGTYVSSISFLALPSQAFATNWNAFVFSVSIPPATWIAVRYFVPFYRKADALSAYEHLEYRFGPWARTYAMACYLLTQLARMGTILYLLALALSPLTGWSVPTLIVLIGLVVLVYTLFGGMEAVIWTDVLQSMVLIGGALVCLGVLLFGLPEGIGQFWDIASASDKFSLGDYGISIEQPTVWVVLLFGLFSNLQNFGIDQSYVQRYQTARSDADARRSVWLGALLYVPISAVFLLIGTGLFVYYRAHPGLLPPDVAAKQDTVFPYFIVHQLPTGVSGLLIAAIVAAAQSTLSSSINCSATLLLCDVYRRYFRPGASEAESMRVLWTMSLAVGLSGIGMALAMMQIQSALDAWWQLASIFSGGMLGLFLLGLLSRTATSRAALVGVSAGVLVIAWMTLPLVTKWIAVPPEWLSPLHRYLTVVVGTMTILVVGLILASLRFGGTSMGDHHAAD
jgi:solute:Na+ symporter, SSS family